MQKRGVHRVRSGHGVIRVLNVPGVLGVRVARAEHPAPDLVEGRAREDAQAGFLFLAAARLDADFDDGEEAVEDVLDGVHVLDARVRDVTLVAKQQAPADHELALVVAQAKCQVAGDGHRRGGHEQDQQPPLPTLRYGAEHTARTAAGAGDPEDQQQRRQREIPGVARQVEDECGRVQPLLRRHRPPPTAGGARGWRARGRARDRPA